MHVHQPIENSERFARKELHGNLDESSLETHHLEGSLFLGRGVRCEQLCDTWKEAPSGGS